MLRSSVDVCRTSRGAVAIVRLSGRYELEEWFATLDDALVRAADNRPVGLLCDLSGSTSLGTRSSVEVQRSAHFVASRAAEFGNRVVAVVHEDHHFGLMRMAQATMDRLGVEMFVVRTEDEAWEWLQG